jgi:Mn-dependent DtxR family transcriptional regulator
MTAPVEVRAARALARGPMITGAVALVLGVSEREACDVLRGLQRDGVVRRIPPGGAWALVDGDEALT